MYKIFRSLITFVKGIFKKQSTDAAAKLAQPMPTPDPQQSPAAIESPTQPVVEQPKIVDPSPDPDENPDPVVIHFPVAEPLPPAATIPSEPVVVEVSVPAAPVLVPDAKTLRNTSIMFGCATKEALISKDSAYRGFLPKQFRSLTPENAAKWGHVHPDANTWNTADLDRLIAYAKTFGARVHGHCHLWGNSVPANVKATTDKTKVAQLMKDHVFGMVDRFGKDIRTWDVTNEALGDNGKLKSTFFYDMFGDELIPMVFDFAHSADPTSELFFSEYGLETNSARTPGLIKLIAAWKTAGVPIHGISSQMHIAAGFNLTNYNSTLKQWAATGLKFHISEIDVNVRTGQSAFNVIDAKGVVTKLFPYTDALKKKSADTWAAVASGYRKYMPVAQQYGITTWAATHAQSSINFDSNGKPILKDYPSLFANDYTPEPAYQELLKVS